MAAVEAREGLLQQLLQMDWQERWLCRGWSLWHKSWIGLHDDRLSRLRCRDHRRRLAPLRGSGSGPAHQRHDEVAKYTEGRADDEPQHAEDAGQGAAKHTTSGDVEGHVLHGLAGAAHPRI